MTSFIPMIAAVRGYAVCMENKKKRNSRDGNSEKRTPRKSLKWPSKYLLIFDTETTTDHVQKVRIGTYQVRKDDELIQSGIFYEPQNITRDEYKIVVAYAKSKNLVLRERESFVQDVFYKYGYHYGGLVIGFNLPFDLSRLAAAIYTSHGWDMRGGFSLELVSNKWVPNVLVRHLNSRAAFIRFAAPPRQVDGRSMRKKFKTKAKYGHFQDIKTLAAALLGGSFSLRALADLLGVEHRKIDTDEHGGPLTAEYLDYAVNDTQTTWECYAALKLRYGEHGLTETPPHRIYSEASLGKAYLREMAVSPWATVQPDFPPELLGPVMHTYYGGRAEIRIRRQITRVLYCDFRSMYPTVCTLMGLWPFVIAMGVETTEATTEAQSILDEVSLNDVRQKDFWRKLHVLVQVSPEDDVLPIRGRYSDGARTIGLNHLKSQYEHWYTLADCIAAKLLSGKVPFVIKAIKFTSKAPQSGLKPILIGGNARYRIDPYTDDFYRRVIELRAEVQGEAKRARKQGNAELAENLDAYQMMLKLLANSTSYGMFAEMNVQSYDRPKGVRCYTMDADVFETATRSVEEPGSNFHPLLATLITGAARLMLATAERVATDHAIGWAFCDTDSLALARPDGMADSDFLGRALAVTAWFDALSPYSDNRPLFKVEDVNYRLKGDERVASCHEPLFAIAISAKRYVLVNLTKERRPVIRKALAHGLGHWLPPYKEKDAPKSIPAPCVPLSELGVDRWHYDIWYQIIMAELEGHPDQVDLSMIPNLDRPAASRYSASTATLLRWFASYNEKQGAPDRVRAFNFMLAFQVSRAAAYTALANGELDLSVFDGGLPAVVAPYNSDPLKASEQCFDRRTGELVPASVLTTYREAIADYHLHSESKFEHGDLFDRGLTYRRHIEVVDIEYIGKEANRWEEQFYLGETPEAQIEYGRNPNRKERFLAALRDAIENFGVSQIADEASVSRQHIYGLLDGEAMPRLATIIRLCRAFAALQQRWASGSHRH